MTAASPSSSPLAAPAPAPAAAPAPASRWRRRARVTLAATVALFVALVAFGYWAVPVIVKSKLETTLFESLDRRATIGGVAFDPFTLKATISDFALADRTPAAPPLLAFDTLTLDVSSASLWRWAPVFDAVRVTKPRVALARNADGTYSVDDIITRLAARPDGPPPEFSLNNIEIDDGAIAFDDKPRRRKHAVDGISIGIPFLSSLPYAAQIRVTPRLAAVVNGSAFALTGSASSPFTDVKEASLDVNLDALPLARYVEYASLPVAAKVKDGALTTRLKVAFVTEKDVPKTLKVSGTARVDRLALTRNDGSPLASAPAIDATIAELDMLARTLKLARVAVDAPNVDLKRLPDGTLELARLAQPPAAPGRAGGPAGASAPTWSISVADAAVAHGTLALADASIQPAFAATLTDVTIGATNLSTGRAPPAHVIVAFDSDGARFDGTADVDLAGLAATGHFALSKFSLARLYPYYGDALALDVRRGALALAGDIDVAAGVAPLRVRLTGGEATLTDVELAVSDEHDPLWRIPQLALAGIDFDLAQRRVAIDGVDGKQAAMRVVREADGGINFARLVRTTAQTGVGTAASGAGGAADATWAYVVRRIAFERATADVEDRSVSPPVKLKLTDVHAVAQNFGNARGAKGTLDFRARTGSGGRIALAGPLATNPLSGDWRIDASGVDMMPLKSYVESATNLLLTGGTLATKGRVAFDAAAPGGARVTFAGDATVSDFGSLDRPTGQELVRWKTLTLTAVDTASAPVHVSIGAVALDDFFARIIVHPDATLNLQRLLAAPDADAAAPARAAVPAATAATTATRSTHTPSRGAAASPPRGSPAAAKLAVVAAPLRGDADLPVTIGRIEVARGNVRFSDFFVKPNYTANLTDVAGSVSALSATQAGDVALDAKVEHLAPVEVRGKINPFARELSLDLTGKARDVDLPPLTPYAAKYAGYSIEKGKLSFDVHYKIEDRKLAAQNKLVLDQLTFGARVDSPDATKLPVHLAVALLKDRNGVIDVELPIAGSLDDPQFSVGGLIIRVIVNLITKIVTAPFAILGALAGGGEQLAFVEFAPGRAELSSMAETKLRTLSKALGDRPGLKLDVTGRAVPAADRDGLKRAQLDAAVRTRRQKSSPAQAAASGADVVADAADYPKLVAAVYDDAPLPDKPKNALGFAKEIPVADMEAMLLASYAVDDEALNDLANRRAQAVKAWLTDQGGVAAERVYLVASKLNADGVKDGAPTRVDFALK